MQTWMLYFTIMTDFRICRKILDDQHVFVTTFFVHLYMFVNLIYLIFKGNLSIMFKYSLILIIITSRIILKIIYMCLEFQMEHNICMPRLIYDLVNLLLFYILMHGEYFATYYFANVQWYTHFQAFVCIVSDCCLTSAQQFFSYIMARTS
jgi:hypothetical protein